MKEVFFDLHPNYPIIHPTDFGHSIHRVLHSPHQHCTIDPTVVIHPHSSCTKQQQAYVCTNLTRRTADKMHLDLKGVFDIDERRRLPPGHVVTQDIVITFIREPLDYVLKGYDQLRTDYGVDKFFFDLYNDDTLHGSPGGLITERCRPYASLFECLKSFTLNEWISNAHWRWNVFTTMLTGQRPENNHNLHVMGEVFRSRQETQADNDLGEASPSLRKAKQFLDESQFFGTLFLYSNTIYVIFYHI